MENFETFRLDQTGRQTQAILDQVSTNTADIAQLRALYEALTQSEPVIIQPSDTWPVADPQENVIYRVIDRVNTPPQSYSDYMWNGTAMVLMATYNNSIDNEPTPGSNNLVKSGGVAASIVFDISAYHASGSTLATYSNLAAALGTDGANVPSAVRKGGMSVKFVLTSDNKYVQYRLMADDWSTDTKDWAIADEGVYVDNPEFVYVKTDADGKILWAIKIDGSIYYGAGVPQQIIDYMNEKLAELSLDEYEDIVAFLSDYLGSDTTLKALIDSKLNAEGLDHDALETVAAVENPEYIQVTTDSEGKILQSRNSEGINKEYVGLETPKVSIDGATIEHINDPEWLDIKLDKDGRIIEGTKINGTHKFYDIEVDTAKTKTYYAHDYGILPTNDAMTNASLMNKILENGNVELRFTIPGTYKLGKSVKLGSNTKLLCQEGVIFTREGTYRNIFINTGASTATFNDNITIDGLNLVITQEGSHTFEYDDPLFGLRGLVAFCFISRLTIRNLVIRSVGGWEFALHINRAQQVIVEHFDIRCEKDGIHVASLQDFVFRDGIISTDDDGIGLNGYDFYDCNLVAGDVKYGVIEKITTLKRPNSPNKGSGVRMMVGAFVNWYDGIKVMNSELVRYGSRVYKVIDQYDSEHPTPAEKVEYTSHTPPTLTSYNGAQAAEGFYWKLNDVDSYQIGNRIDVSDIIFRDIKINQGGYWVMQDVWPDGSNNIRRTLHPDVQPENYPHTDNIVLENIVNYGSASPRVFETCTPIITSARLTNVSGFLRKFECPVNVYSGVYAENTYKRILLDNYDFTSRSVQEPNDVQAGENTDIIIRDCIKEGNIIVDSQGSIKSNCSISALPSNPKKGDILILDGTFKNYNGSEWI